MTIGGWRGSVVFGMCALVAGCGSDATDGIETNERPIVGGTVDTTHEAVMALLRVSAIRAGDGRAGSCSGTTIATRGASGFVVTAAHCLFDDPPGAEPARPLDVAEIGLLPGTDWLASYDMNAIFPVVDARVHPDYDGSVTSPYDVAVVRFVGANDTTPTILPLAADEDALAGGTPVTLVGYGVTAAGVDNSLRMRVDKALSEVTPTSIRYAQTDGAGTCAGDSGGPVLVAAPGGERLAATTTFGDSDCQEFGEAVRASRFGDFFATALASAPIELDCAECRLASTAPGGRCAPAASDCANESAPCGLYRACAERCLDEPCRDACARSYPSGAATNAALRDCACGDACAGSCAGEATCHEPAVAAPATAADPGCSCGLAGGRDSNVTLLLLVVLVARARRATRRFTARRPGNEAR